MLAFQLASRNPLITVPGMCVQRLCHCGDPGYHDPKQQIRLSSYKQETLR